MASQHDLYGQQRILKHYEWLITTCGFLQRWTGPDRSRPSRKEGSRHWHAHCQDRRASLQDRHGRRCSLQRSLRRQQGRAGLQCCSGLLLLPRAMTLLYPSHISLSHKSQQPARPIAAGSRHTLLCVYNPSQHICRSSEN